MVSAMERDLVVITFDALRFDVATSAHREGQTPFLHSLLPDGWEERHSPGSFTFAAHAALFAGFWPTSATDTAAQRPFAVRFPGSRSVGPKTMLLDGENIVAGLRSRGFHTICIGGVGFFNPATPLGSVFPSYFDESHWRPDFGVAAPNSARAQVTTACERLAACDRNRPLFLFVNVSATHPPTHFYRRGATADNIETQAAALAYVDRQLPPLFDALRARGREGTAYLMSDHGTLFGEEGRVGHRQGHPLVWTVPYAEYEWTLNR